MNTYTNKKGMTVKELINVLKAYPQNAMVVLSSDEEGNDFGVLGAIDQDSKDAIVMFPMSGTVESE